MRADQPVAVPVSQGRDVGPAADQTFAIVRALKNFINKKEHRRRLSIMGGIEDGFEALDFRIEKREPGLQGIIDADTAGQPAPGPLEAAGAHRRAGLREAEINPDGPEEGTLA